MRRFYQGPYSTAFPDEDEREAFANMVTYLRGSGGSACDYHVVLVVDGDDIIGGSISDYFAPSNSAVIEFITVAVDRQTAGVGSRLLAETERRLQASAARRGRELPLIMAEINDPRAVNPVPETMDPFARARWWAKRGFARLDFPYVQPPLSPQQQPVRHLALSVKLLPGTTTPPALRLQASAVDAFIRDYLVYAMRIAEPTASADYLAMADWLSRHPVVRLVPLDA